jgi:hypothetical protein
MENYTSPLELCVTILANGIVMKDFVEKLEETQESCRKVGNSLKRAALCGSLHALIQRVKERDEKEIVYALFFLYHGSESGYNEIVEEKVLTKSERDILKEYGFSQYQYRNSEIFPLEEWKDIFTNFDFLQVVHVNQQYTRHLKMNRYKMKEVMNCKITSESHLIELIDRILKEKREKVYLYGISNYVSLKVKAMVTYREGHLTKEEVWEWKGDEEMKGHLALLEERMKEIGDEKKVDLFVFGRIKIEIKEHVEGYLLKELFIEERKIKILKEIVEPEVLNFKIIPVRSLEKGDIGQMFIEKYNGLMGIKYFA